MSKSELELKSEWPICIDGYTSLGDQLGTYDRVGKYICNGNKNRCAIKCFDLKHSENLAKLKNEIEQIKALSGSENIIKYYADFFDATNQCHYVVMELADLSLGYLVTWRMIKYAEEGIEQFDRFFDEDFIAPVAYQILEGLEFIHSRGRAHRDIKPSNILLNRAGCIKICDFDFTGVFFDANSNKWFTMGTALGTTGYMAPEILLNFFDDKQQFNGVVPKLVSASTEKGKFSYGPAVDIWSLGILVYVLAKGNLTDYFTMVKDDREALLQVPPVLDNSNFSTGLCNLVKDCLQKDEPELRPTAIKLKTYTFFHGKQVSPAYLKWWIEENELTDDIF